MKAIWIILILLLAVLPELEAQQTDRAEKVFTDRVDSLLDDVLFGDNELKFLLGLKKNYQFIYFRSNLDSRTFYAGREIGVNQYNWSNQLFYLNSNGIYGGISGAWYSQMDPGYRTTILKIGYGNNLNKFPPLRFRTSIDYYISHYQDPEYESSYFGSFNAGLTLKKKNIGTRFDASFLLGDAFNPQFNWSLYHYFDIARLGKHAKIRLEPEVSLFFGNEIAEFGLTEAIFDPITNLAYSSYYDEMFGLMNVQLELPLAISLKNFDINLSYQLNIPRTMGDISAYPGSSFFGFSVGYIFSL